MNERADLLINCPACGKEISIEAKKCPHCGHPQRKKKKKTPIIIGIFVIIFLGVLIYLGLSYKNNILELIVKSGSMEPAINAGETIKYNKKAYKSKTPKRGDIIAFNEPFENNSISVKRVIGLPGETVEIKKGKVLIYKNDELVETLEEDYINGEWTWKNDKYTFLVPDESYLVLGDNRNNSKDIRWWYDEIFKNSMCKENEIYIQQEDIIGKVLKKE